MNEPFIDVLLALFWGGFIALNVWLLRCRPLDEPAPVSSGTTAEQQ